jgi:DNA-binding response OmpR family regulator
LNAGWLNVAARHKAVASYNLVEPTTNNKMNPSVLIIEDEERIAYWVRSYFQRAGFRTLVAAEGQTGLSLALSERPDLVILDLMLPGIDGMEICRSVRREADIPIIMLTAKGKEIDRIEGLEQGADDYVVKPFSPGELVARARAVLRRAQGKRERHEVLCKGDICLEPANHHCTVNGKPVELSRIQFVLLEALMRHAGRALSREQLLGAAFAGDYDGFDRGIDAHIRRLRQRIEPDPAEPRYVVTVFGVGYKFVE